MFSVHTTPNEFENKSHSETHQFVFEETLRQRNDVIIVTLSFSKSSVIKMFSVHQKIKNSFSLKSVSVQLRFRDGLVWTEGLTVKIKLRFRGPLSQCGRAFRVLHRAMIHARSQKIITKQQDKICCVHHKGWFPYHRKKGVQ